MTRFSRPSGSQVVGNQADLFCSKCFSESEGSDCWGLDSNFAQQQFACLVLLMSLQLLNRISNLLLRVILFLLQVSEKVIKQGKYMDEESLLINSVAHVKEQNLVYKRWTNMLEGETSNSNFDGHDDIIQSPPQAW